MRKYDIDINCSFRNKYPNTIICIKCPLPSNEKNTVARVFLIVVLSIGFKDVYLYIYGVHPEKPQRPERLRLNVLSMGMKGI